MLSFFCQIILFSTFFSLFSFNFILAAQPPVLKSPGGGLLRVKSPPVAPTLKPILNISAPCQPMPYFSGAINKVLSQALPKIQNNRSEYEIPGKKGFYALPIEDSGNLRLILEITPSGDIIFPNEPIIDLGDIDLINKFKSAAPKSIKLDGITKLIESINRTIKIINVQLDEIEKELAGGISDKEFNAKRKEMFFCGMKEKDLAI